jgi:acetylornithine/succinyldiaminopimelate/putrescine aminotransferase
MTRVGQHVWKTISDPAFLSHVNKMGKLMKEKGEKLVKTSPVVREIRGSGLLMGIELREGVSTSTFVDLCRENGVLVVSASGNTVRLIPALIVTPAEIDAAFVVFDKVISQIEALIASGKLK